MTMNLEQGQALPVKFKANQTIVFDFFNPKAGPVALCVYGNPGTSDTVKFLVECEGKRKNAAWRGFLGTGFIVELPKGAQFFTVTADSATSADIQFRPWKSSAKVRPV
jgi:hypothetical protein